MATMNYVLAFDQGTTSSRALLFDREGRIRARAQREFAQIFPQSGWVEHDPEAIWVSQLAVAREVLREAGVSIHEVAAIGITNQRETCVVWDKRTGRPLMNAIVWQDRRTAAACEQLKNDGHECVVSEKTGLLLDPYFSATKLAWILDHVPGARSAAQRAELLFGTIDTWLVWKLSAGHAHVTDATNASRTALFNIHTLDWDDALLALFDIPRVMLPRIVDSSGVFASTDAQWFGESIALAAIAGDQQAALFGQRCIAPGMIKNTYGTGCFALLNTGSQAIASRHRLLSTVAAISGGATHYALEGSVFIGGALVQWLRDGLGLIKSSAEIEHLAASVPDNGGVVLVPALTGLGAPHWDAYARGTIIGMTRATSKAHIARAALEAIAFQSADLIEAMRADSGIPITQLRVDGGAASNNLLMQFQADVLGVPVVRPLITETTALGAAYLAGLGIGMWQDPAALDRHWQAERAFEPAMSRDRVEALKAAWQRALTRAMRWLA
jgi:glycerol kinase